MGLKFFIGLISGVLLGGCAAGLGYKYYGIDAKSYEGSLLGPTPADDIAFTTCQPDDQVKGKCVVLLKAEFKAMGSELMKCRSDLNDCQRDCK